MAMQLILYGCGGIGRNALNFFGKERVACFCDSQGGLIREKYGIKVISVDELEEVYQGYILIICAELPIADEIADMLSKRGMTDFLVYKKYVENVLNKITPDEFTKKYADSVQRDCLQKEYYKDRTERLTDQLAYLKKHVDITTLKPATGYFKKCQMDVMRVANEFFEYIRELDIKPFLIGGGLIGAIRHNGFVPWDDDLDFGLMREDYEKLVSFCKENCKVYMYEGSWGESHNSGVPHDLEEMMQTYPDQWITNIQVGEICIVRSRFYMRRGISFWPYDYYRDTYTLEDHTRYLAYIEGQTKKIDYIPDIIRFLRKEIAENDNISKQPTGKILSGIDNGEWILRYTKKLEWIQTKDMLPLKRHKFEETEFFIPQNPDAFLAYEYPGYMGFPADFGVSMHLDSVERETRKHFSSVEFYPLNLEELERFIKLYEIFEESKIFSKFIIEPTEKSIWRNDYEEAVRILDANAVRYGSQCAPDVSFVFMTRESSKLKNYQSKKVCVDFQFGAAQDSVLEPDTANSAFDYRLVCTSDKEEYLTELVQMIKREGTKLHGKM